MLANEGGVGEWKGSVRGESVLVVAAGGGVEELKVSGSEGREGQRGEESGEVHCERCECWLCICERSGLILL